MLKFANTSKKARMTAGQKISKKYRVARRRKQREYRHLQAVLPALAAKPGVDEVEVVEEAINYIDYLHAQILQRMWAGKLTVASIKLAIFYK